jgi:TonB-dependent starch-binding outer membrane protein SusC
MNKALQKLFIVIALLVSSTTFAQTYKGQVVDDSGSPLIGANVFAKGTQNGTKTNADGKFALDLDKAVDFLVVTYVGMNPKMVAATTENLGVISLTNKSRAINDVVVVGYGSQKKKDITSAVISIKSKDFNQGTIGTPEQLIIGKVPGVQITTNSGEPGVGSRIRIRGGASLNGPNDPLYVIDGVPVDNFKMVGSANPLNLINPNDIESVDILKDGSATAIYGVRGTNGVILITTKKGNRKSDRVNVSYSTNYGISQLTNRRVDMMNAWEFKNTVGLLYDSSQNALLGNDSTDWMKEITRTAQSWDNNVSITGGLKGLPYRLSVGNTIQQGLLYNNGLNRLSGGLNLSPSFFKNALKVDINIKNSITNSNFTNTGAIGSALSFDPTQRVLSGSAEAPYGGYFEYIKNGQLNTIAPDNPLGLVKQIDNTSRSNRLLGNVQLDYKIPFLKGLRANLNLGMDNAKSLGTEIINSEAAQYFVRGGKTQSYSEKRNNKLFDFYLNYAKSLKNINSVFDVTLGHSYQDFINDYPTFRDFNNVGEYAPAATPFKTQSTLIAFFGRANYAYKGRYLLNAALRNEYGSALSEGNKSALFPSVSAAWRISDEGFVKEGRSAINELKLRAGYGITGQNQLFLNDRPANYLAIPIYNISDPTAQYPLGDSYYPLFRPNAVNRSLTYEKTASTNLGLDYGFYKNRINGSIDLYNRLTTDLFNDAPIPAGTAPGNRLIQNIGSLTNRGIEAVVNFVPVATRNVTLDFGVNFTHNRNNIVSMTNNPNDTSFAGIATGGIDGGSGANIQIFKPGNSINSFYTYEQVYNTAGKVVEGAYVDQNGDGIINEKDLVVSSRSGEPRNLFGFSSNVRYKNASLGFVARAQTGSYNYNNPASNLGNLRETYNTAGYFTNIHGSYFDTRFNERQLYSNYYLEDASFFRLDNVNLGYDFGNISRNNTGANLRASFTVQNVFIITNYTGIDPEVAGGVDKNIYPRPRTYTVGLHLDF